MLINILLVIIGLALLLYGVIVFLAAQKNSRLSPSYPEPSEPLVAPFELSVGQPTLFSFVAEREYEHTVGVNFERAIDFDELRTAIHKIAKDKDFEVHLEEDGKPIEVSGYSGTGYGQDTISLYLTSFLAHEGRRYDVTITPRKAYPELRITNPQAKVAAAFWIFKASDALGKLIMRLAIWPIFIGLGLVLLGWWRSQAPPLNH